MLSWLCTYVKKKSSASVKQYAKRPHALLNRVFAVTGDSDVAEEQQTYDPGPHKPNHGV